jgi:hypothetical protein
MGGDLLAAEPGGPDDPGQGTARRRGDRVAVMQAGRVDHEPLLGGEHAQVGVGADADPAFPTKTGQLGRTLGHPVGQAGQAQLEGGDAAPGRAEVAAVEVLELGRAGRVVRGDQVDEAVGQAPPQPLAVPGVADGWAALELGGPVGDRAASKVR